MVMPTRPSIPDQLERASDALDRLIRDARLSPIRNRHDVRYAALEERAQAISASIVAPFRGEHAPTAPPLSLETKGTRSNAWF